MARQSEGRPRGADVRSTSYRPEPPRSTHTSRGERVVPQYEERRPDYASDYFDSQPRATARKEPEYTERAPPRRATESKEKPRGFMRSNKESDKDRRKEKPRQTEREVRKERERKRDPYVEEESESEDDYARRTRHMREEDAARRAREQYHEPSPKAQRDVSDVPYDDRARTMASQTAAAWDYIRSSRGGAPQPRTEEHRPSPVRMESSKDRLQSIKLDHGGRPAGLMRRGSVRPGKESKDEKKMEKESSRKASSRTPERRSSAENVDERRPPPLNTSKSSPADIHIPSEKQRATSLQPDSAAMPPPPPQVRRSETMPYSSSARHSENVAPKSSRATENKNGEPTPATTPDNQAPPHKFPYNNRPYADDAEYATPEGYRTSIAQERARPSFTRRVTRSPSPMKDSSRELPREYAPRSRESTYDSVPRSRDFTPREMPRSRESRESPQPMPDEPYRDPRDGRQPAYRASSARYADRPQPMPARTTSYVYTPAGVEPVSRMSPVREPSPRDAPLYGETPGSRSPHQRPVDDEVRYAKPMRAASIRMQSGYGYARPNGERPQVSRNNSGGVYRSARAQPA